ncbi:hypothetical protein CSUI_000458 [Cystoisospora suis]|uniref:Uncharacterized protein n=1 Tax=Cystoisospora suis TaxID=483139 RepID=A0A2C6KNX1_9APIC|nr:hypothetical protein CSUI_000458 [Cystoisospora suis]
MRSRSSKCRRRPWERVNLFSNKLGDPVPVDVRFPQSSKDDFASSELNHFAVTLSKEALQPWETIDMTMDYVAVTDVNVVLSTGMTPAQISFALPASPKKELHHYEVNMEAECFRGPPHPIEVIFPYGNGGPVKQVKFLPGTEDELVVNVRFPRSFKFSPLADECNAPESNGLPRRLRSRQFCAGRTMTRPKAIVRVNFPFPHG